jgi:hypothetical protein
MPRCVAAVVVVVTLASGASACRQPPAPDLAPLADDFALTTLSFSPSRATQAGLHAYVDPRTGDTLRLDGMLDDFSPPALRRRRLFYRYTETRLEQIARDRLDEQTRADYDLLVRGLAWERFSLDTERFYQRKPQLYPEVLGSALLANIDLAYADTATRAWDLTRRLEEVPAYVADAMVNLLASNDVWRRVALRETAGVIDLVRGAGAEFVHGTPAEARYRAALPAALAALWHYQWFVRDTLSRRGEYDWRMGRAMFERKWRDVLRVSETPDELLRAAEDSMDAVRARMLRLALPLHDAWFPEHRHRGDSAAVLNAVVYEVLARIGAQHTRRDSLVARARLDVATLEKFVTVRRVLSQDDFSNLEVIPTPVFLRGIHGASGAVAAPALQPRLGAFYWVTPVPDAWPWEWAEARLREYNRYRMLELAMHEAVPGHLVQGTYANRVAPPWRRLLRMLCASGPYVEGWAVYAERMMRREGMTGGDSVEARLMELKADLRLYADVVIDVRLHTTRMPTDSAVAILVRKAFQEGPEAVAKLQRAQLDYVQLSTGAVGLREWFGFRRAVEAREGRAFSLCRFHDAALSYGPLPVPVVERLFLDGVPPPAVMPASRCRAPASS